MKRTERDAIEELAQLLDGRLSPDEAGAPIRRLGALVATIGTTEVVERPTPAARAALRNQLVADIEAGQVSSLDRVRDAVWDRTARVRNSARVGLASAVAAGMLGSAGVAAAAQHALPGDALYGIKRATESVRLSLASGLPEQAQVHVALAEERLDELQDGSARLSPDESVDTLARMDAASLAASGALIQAVTEGADTALLADLLVFTERQRAGLIDVYDDLPAGVRPFAEESLEVLRRIDVEVASTIGPCAVCEQIASGSSIGSVTPGDGVGADRCDCLAPTPPPPPREPGVSVPSSPPTAPAEEPVGEEPREPTPTREPVDVVPSLPGPLDGVGDAVDDVLEDLVQGTVETTTSLPLPEVEPTEVESLDDLGGLLEPTQP
ncbi:MAG: hypothetical protein KY461_07805 [Actinobacteria bacterium]|nr:hypothetical protein [Actinomycetota bacterium]